MHLIAILVLNFHELLPPNYSCSMLLKLLTSLETDRSNHRPQSTQFIWRSAVAFLILLVSSQIISASEHQDFVVVGNKKHQINFVQDQIIVRFKQPVTDPFLNDLLQHLQYHSVERYWPGFYRFMIGTNVPWSELVRRAAKLRTLEAVRTAGLLVRIGRGTELITDNSTSLDVP